jgi:uncharacterized protein (TIGR03067 family)
MRWVITPLLAILTFWTGGFADDPPKTPSAKDELQSLQGTWQVTAWEENGKPITVRALKEREAFFGGNVFIFRKGEKVHQAGAIQLDPSKTLRTMNLSVKEGEGKDGVMLGIYSFESDTLKLCFDPEGQTRPDTFKPDAKAGFTVVTLKKPKPPADEQVDIVGKYRSELIETSGTVVTTQVVIERRGDAYQATYTVGDKVLFIGTALRKGDLLSMCWVSAGQAGVSLYKIEKGPKLVGEYTTMAGIGLTGKEVLTPWRKIVD